MGYSRQRSVHQPGAALAVGQAGWLVLRKRYNRGTVLTLGPGQRLGPYEILSPLGAGGMGEVWQARDTRLGRTVAIKISKEQFSERFEQEARAVASLNHPHICQLYDVGPDYL